MELIHSLIQPIVIKFFLCLQHFPRNWYGVERKTKSLSSWILQVGGTDKQMKRKIYKRIINTMRKNKVENGK